VERDPGARDRGRTTPQAGDGDQMSLRSAPVVLVLDPSMRPIVAAGIARAGGHPETLAIDLGAGGRPLQQHWGVTAPEAVMLTAPAGALDALVRAGIEACALGGRLLTALSLHLSSGPDRDSLALLGEPQLPEVTVAVPSIDDDEERRSVWTALGAVVDGRHHLVDVDGKPALDELADVGPVVEGDLLWMLGAGAAGVLAGRMVAGNRRWPPPDDD
jgi:hypothetical protein